MFEKRSQWTDLALAVLAAFIAPVAGIILNSVYKACRRSLRFNQVRTSPPPSPVLPVTAPATRQPPALVSIVVCSSVATRSQQMRTEISALE